MSKNKEIQKKRRQHQRRQQLLIMGGVVVVALGLIGFTFARAVYENSQPIGEIKPIERVDYPFAQGKVLGSSAATVVIQEFADFQCPFCGEFSRSVEAELIASLVKTGKVRYEYHHYIVVDGNVGGGESRRAAEASECANDQGQFWNYHKLLFANQKGEGQGAFSDRRLKAMAETLSLDTAAFNACFDSGKFTQAVLADERLARSLGVNSTPTLFVNGQQVVDPSDLNEIQQRVEAALNGK